MTIGLFMTGMGLRGEFREEAAKQAPGSGYSVSDVAKRLGTPVHSGYLWLKIGEENPR